jgi:AmmeMemoRadiSam system protein B
MTGLPDAAAPLGWLVPHAGLEYSGVVAAAAWRLLARPPAATGPAAAPATVVILGTNHRAAWLDGIAVWSRGAWETPLGPAVIDEELAAAIVRLGSPFVVDLDAHLGEHSIEVQLPFLREVAPTTRIVPLAVATGIGRDAIDAGARLGALLAARRGSEPTTFLAISSDMAHYPSAADAEGVTAELLPALLRLDPEALAVHEVALRDGGIDGLACGMCGIEPAVVGLAALRAAGAARGAAVAAATSADAGGPADRTVGYLAVAFTR